MKSKLVKLISVIYIITLLMIQLSTLSLAASGYIPDPGGEGGGQIKAAAGTILSIILAIGAAVATIILVWLGIKYVTASPDEKANIKKSAVSFLIGCVVIFGFSGLITFIATVAENIGDTLG